MFMIDYIAKTKFHYIICKNCLKLQYLQFFSNSRFFQPKLKDTSFFRIPGLLAREERFT